MTAYPLYLHIRPLTSWPGQLTAMRVESRFRSTLSATGDLLRREIGELGAIRDFVVELDIPPEQFRIDGGVRAAAKIGHPGVVLSLPTSRVGPLRYAVDLHPRWEDNLRAIALTLGALRAVDRWGVTARGEQYTGFAALPAAPSRTPYAQAMLDLAEYVGWHVPQVENDPQGAYRAAVKLAHPDRGGAAAAFRDVQQWWAIIQAAQG